MSRTFPTVFPKVAVFPSRARRHEDRHEESFEFHQNFAKMFSGFDTAGGDIRMKNTVAFAILFWTILAGAAGATIYQYTDDNGQVHYTNEESSIPADKLDQVTATEETESGPAAPAPKYDGPIYPIIEHAQAVEEERAKEKEKARQKAELESEYEALLKEKEALDNDKSFQKRRYKRKYQNRPYITELVAKEAELNQRLAELEEELKAY